MFQKVVNIIAVASGVVSLTVVGSGVYVYVQRDQLIDNVKQQVLQGFSDSLPGMDSFGGGTLGGPGVGGATGAAAVGPVGTPPVAAPF